ncbi:MAG TPA: ATP-binding protein [Kofleriaceae bacterium]|jgi:signal transduction histidine kinase/FixJ family two-component response regulator|nr:ATP-binding protein [Kofleriaceae bacterium]
MSERLSVLIVDDSEDDALLMARELRRSGFEPVTRRVDAAPAMTAALAERPWELLLVDYRMPHFGVEDALQLVQQAGLDVPVILVSATVGEETAVAMMKAGAHDFVLKNNLGRLGPAVMRELRDADVRRRRRWAEAALEILAEAGRLVVEGPDFGEVVRRAAGVAVPRLAAWSIVYARDRSSISDAIATACRPEIDCAALDELARNYPPALEAADPVFGSALRTRKPTLVSTVSDDELVAMARDARHLELLRALEPRSLIVIPQIAREQLVGILVLAAQRPGRYNTADLGIAKEIGGRVALVVENARLVRAREEFISTAIHEIKTPIAVIKTGVQLMQQLAPARREERLPELLARLDRQCNRLSRLVTDVLEVSRLDLNRVTITRRRTDLAALVERAVGEMQEVSDRHTLIIRRNDAVTIEADPDRIAQVLTNLIGNAIKYSPAGGAVEIESRRSDGSVTVSVRDHGIGIPREKQGRIFERFYRAHVGTPYEHASSLGVGLYLTHEFVTRHGGRMWFESQEGVGSTFAFSLPLTEDRG